MGTCFHWVQNVTTPLSSASLNTRVAIPSSPPCTFIAWCLTLKSPVVDIYHLVFHINRFCVLSKKCISVIKKYPTIQKILYSETEFQHVSVATTTTSEYISNLTALLQAVNLIVHTQMCFVWIWEQTAIISLYSVNWLVFITETECVYCAVRTGSLYTSTFCPHSVFMCFVWIWEQTTIISLYSINWLVFITETECVYCAVRAGYDISG